MKKFDGYHEAKLKLNELFRKLRANKIYAYQDFQCCNTCASAELDNLGITDNDTYAYYHHQSKQDFDENGRVHLGWGGDGQKIAQIAQDTGIIVNWNGTDEQKIELVFKI